MIGIVFAMSNLGFIAYFIGGMLIGYGLKLARQHGEENS